jgi:hypothetical protein
MTSHPARRPGQASAATITRWGPPRPAPANALSAAPGPATPGRADSLTRLSGRIPQPGTPDQSSCRPGSPRAPSTQVRLAALTPPPGRHGRSSPRTGRPPNRTANPLHQALPCPGARHHPLPGSPRQGAPAAPPCGRYAPLDPARPLAEPGSHQRQGAESGHPKPGRQPHKAPPCSHRAMQVRAHRRAGTVAIVPVHCMADVIALVRCAAPDRMRLCIRSPLSGTPTPGAGVGLLVSYMSAKRTLKVSDPHDHGH